MTIELLDPETAQSTKHEKGWKVVIFNDDVTPYDVVVFSIQSGAGLSEEVAEMITKEAHNTDGAIVKHNLSEEKANIIAETIHGISKVKGRFPGVRVEAQKDE
jgi:ATP-dependent Clp protease adapter protein ClpS